MNTLLKGKHGKLVLVILLTAVATVGIWNILIGPQRTRLKAKAGLVSETKEKLSVARHSLDLSSSFKAGLASAQQRLESMEFKMPTGDVYRWATRTFDSLKTNDVELISLEPPRISQLNTLPTVPYRAATFSLSGTAYYQDFGAFLANLENSFPHMQLRRLELKPTHFGEAIADEQEKLAFKIEVVSFVKGSSPEP